MNNRIETLSEHVHNSWEKEKKSQGFHAPNDCKSENHKSFMTADYKHQQRLEDNINPKFFKWCDKCHTDMYPYAELPENIKEYDRVTVRTVLQAIEHQESLGTVNLEGIVMKYTVIKNDDLEKHLTEKEISLFSNLQSKVMFSRLKEGKKKENIYVVVNTDEPYADEVINIMKRHGHWG